MTGFAELSVWLARLGIDPLIGGFLAGLLVGLLWGRSGRRSSAAVASSVPPTLSIRHDQALHPTISISLQINGQERPLSAEETASVMGPLQRRNKIGAIKALRALSGLGLKQSKDLIEVLERESRPS